MQYEKNDKFSFHKFKDVNNSLEVENKKKKT